MRYLAFIPVVLSGCALFNTVKDVKDGIKGVTEPTVAQALILSVQEPTDPNLAAALQAAQFQTGTGVSLFLSDSITEPSEAPLEGARATLHGSTTAAFNEDGGGSYSIAPDVGPAYRVGELWDIQVDGNGDPSIIEIELPPPADLDVPPNHPTQADLVLDLDGQGYQSVLVVVINTLGQVTYTNEPKDMAEALEFSGKGEDLEVFSIPGVEAFGEDALYAVGIAGLRSNEPDGVVNMNTVLSGLQAGEMVWYPVSAVPL